MIVNATVAGDWLIARLDKAPLAYRAAMALAMQDVSQYLYDRVYEKLSGDVLQVQSGNLRSALQHDTIDTGSAIVARVYISGIPYARIQERGGTTRPHEIVATLASVMRFEVGGSVVYTQRVRHPGSRIPESMYMRSVLISERSRVRAMMNAALKQAKAI